MRWLLAILILAASSYLPAVAEEDTIVGEAVALDSDVLRIDGKIVMLFGIDGPERNQPCWERDGRAWACSRVATRQLALFIDRMEVRCEPRGKPDPFKRIPAVCFAGDESLNEGMVRKGLALAVREQTTEFVKAEDEAKAKKTGMWRGTFIPPWDYREMMIRD